MKTLKEKYPVNDDRLQEEYQKIGLPKRYWLSDPLDDSKLQRWLASLEAGEWLAVIGEHQARISWFLSDILKNLDGKSKFMDFSDLLVKLSDGATRNRTFLLEFDNIAITNIRRSSFYEDEIQLFISYLTRLYDSPINKNVILGLHRDYFVKTEEAFEELICSLWGHFTGWEEYDT